MELTLQAASRLIRSRHHVIIRTHRPLLRSTVTWTAGSMLVCRWLYSRVQSRKRALDAALAVWCRTAQAEYWIRPVCGANSSKQQRTAGNGFMQTADPDA
jgi:hypothetical protein